MGFDMKHEDVRFEGKLAHIGVDAVSGPTDWAGRSIKLERAMGMQGRSPAPPPAMPNPARMHLDATTSATADAVTGATSRAEADAVTGAPSQARDARARARRSGKARKRKATMDKDPNAPFDSATGATVDATSRATVDAVSGATQAPDAAAGAFDCDASAEDADAATGATPGVAAACKELGMSSVADVTRELGIKLPGVA